MDTTVTLDEARFKVVTEKARALGVTPEEYLQRLIDADSRTFDEILEPARQGFDGIDDDELDKLTERAIRAARTK